MATKKPEKTQKESTFLKSRLVPSNLRIKIKNKLKTNILIAIVILILILGTIIWGRVFYQGWIERREEIANYINNSTDRYNITTRESQEIILSINELIQFDQENPTEISENISKIKEQIRKIEATKTNINSDIEFFQSKGDQNTDQVNQKFIDSSLTKIATLEGVETFLNYQVCLIDSSNRQTTNLDEFKTNIEGFTDSGGDVSLENKLQFVSNAQEKINQNIEINKNLPGCFSGRYGRYLTNKIKSDLVTDTQLYENYSASLTNLSSGLQSSDSPAVQSATESLVQLSSQNPVFFVSDSFKEAIQKPTEEIKQQADSLQTQEKILTETINNLKTRYLL